MSEKIEITLDDFGLPEIDLPAPTELINKPRIGWYCRETVGIGIVNPRGVKRLKIYDKE